jgi:2-polyprenyl-6-hydroxyphenyl methylase/3-demethylubiquinone-9 3-methyltransferase
MSNVAIGSVEDRHFEFGENWTRFLQVLNDARIEKAEESLKQMLRVSTLSNQTFLDIGSGSGLFSLAARRLGARVHSFDYDKRSVACTLELKRRYCSDDKGWTIEEGSAMDEEYLRSLGQFDVVYSWGVLQHTGAMWRAFENVVPLVKEGGILFLAIFNDQEGASRRWRVIKRVYNRSPHILRPFISVPIILFYEGRYAIMDLLKGRNPLGPWIHSQDSRGMHKWYNWMDWIGGYPFEVAKPEAVFEFYRVRGFRLVTLKTRAGRGCNEYVFEKGT